MPDISIGRFRGGFCVYWHDDAGKRRRYQLAARTRAEAEAEALDVYRRQNPLEGPPRISRLWDDYRIFLGDRPTGRNMVYMGKAVLPHFGHLRPDQITHQTCLDYTSKRREAGISDGSIHTELGYLRSTLKYALKCGTIQRAPHIWRPAKPKSKERYLTHAEIQRLLGATTTPHIHLALVLLLGTAARVGAVLDLTWDRVDFDRGIIDLRIQDATTRKGRATVPMNGMTRPALQGARNLALTDYVIEYAGKPVSSIRTGFAAACKRAQLRDVTIHTLRHTAAVHMVAAGIPIEKVGQFLGHSNLAVTYSTYARYAPDHLSDAAEVLNFAKIRKVP